MRERRDILAGFERLCAAGVAGVLASVVSASGSTYRRVGARMLLLPDDTMIGLIGGGCLEGDLLLRAQRVRAGAGPLLVRYDAEAEDDRLWGLGLGCAGVVEVLLERVGRGAPGPLDALRLWSKTRQRGAIATIITGPRTGARSTLGEREAEPQGLREPAIDRALRETLASGRALTLTLTTKNEFERCVVEAVAPPLRLAMFGAGPDAPPLAHIAVELGWEVSVLDHRPAFARREHFPASARVMCSEVAKAVALAAPGPDTHCVLMTHHYLNDRVLLRDALATAAPYIAVLGPKRRCEDLLADLRKAGLETGERQRARVFAPAGLDLGADAPETIALSIAAEIQAFANGHRGGPLRERSGPIHEPEAS